MRRYPILLGLVLMSTASGCCWSKNPTYPTYTPAANYAPAPVYAPAATTYAPPPQQVYQQPQVICPPNPCQ